MAQQAQILLLDEPTTFLDISHQVEVLDLLTDLNHARGTTVVMVLHDLNLAAAMRITFWRWWTGACTSPASRKTC